MGSYQKYSNFKDGVSCNMLEPHKSAKDTFYKCLRYVHSRTTVEFAFGKQIWVAFNEALDGTLQKV